MAHQKWIGLLLQFTLEYAISTRHLRHSCSWRVGVAIEGVGRNRFSQLLSLHWWIKVVFSLNLDESKSNDYFFSCGPLFVLDNFFSLRLSVESCLLWIEPFEKLKDKYPRKPPRIYDFTVSDGGYCIHLLLRYYFKRQIRVITNVKFFHTKGTANAGCLITSGL